jgi:hypothetical protein
MPTRDPVTDALGQMAERINQLQARMSYFERGGEVPLLRGFQWAGGAGGTTLSTGSTEYVSPTGAGLSGTETSVNALLAVAATLATLRISLVTAPGASKSRTFTVRKNGVATSAVVTISGTDTTGSWSGSVDFAAGDLISLESVPTGTPAASLEDHGLRFTET